MSINDSLENGRQGKTSSQNIQIKIGLCKVILLLKASMKMLSRDQIYNNKRFNERFLHPPKFKYYNNSSRQENITIFQSNIKT